MYGKAGSTHILWDTDILSHAPGATHWAVGLFSGLPSVFLWFDILFEYLHSSPLKWKCLLCAMAHWNCISCLPFRRRSQLRNCVKFQKRLRFSHLKFLQKMLQTTEMIYLFIYLCKCTWLVPAQVRRRIWIYWNWIKK